MLAAASAAIDDFAGGTRLGESLASLRRRHARRLIGRRTLVLVISDGLDTGEPRGAGSASWTGSSACAPAPAVAQSAAALRGLRAAGARRGRAAPACAWRCWRCTTSGKLQDLAASLAAVHAGTRHRRSTMEMQGNRALGGHAAAGLGRAERPRSAQDHASPAATRFEPTGENQYAVGAGGEDRAGVGQVRRQDHARPM